MIADALYLAFGETPVPDELLCLPVVSRPIGCESDVFPACDIGDVIYEIFDLLFADIFDLDRVAFGREEPAAVADSGLFRRVILFAANFQLPAAVPLLSPVVAVCLARTDGRTAFVVLARIVKDAFADLRRYGCGFFSVTVSSKT